MVDTYPLEVIETIFGELKNASTCFRLVNLWPAPELSDPILCQLSHFQIWDDVKYEALSWCWGDVSLTELIRLQGFDWPAPANLVVALRHLRRKTETRVLWIDALSIMQGPYGKTLDERAKQVQLMKTIYTNANHVMVWLGVPSRNVETFLRTFFYDGKLLAEELRDNPDDTIPSLLELLNNAWFSRLWIIQEVVLAKDASILCGDLTISLKKLFRELVLYRQRMQEKARSMQMVSWHRALENFISQVASIFINQQDKRQKWETASFSSNNPFTAFMGSQPFNNSQDAAADVRAYASLLTQCRYQQASDPRDKMYGLLGLAHDSVSSLLCPDYNEDVPSAYVRTAGVIIVSSSSLYLLSQAHKTAESEYVDILPSWVPDWTIQEAFRDPWSHTPARDDREMRFKAGTVPDPMISHSGPETLVLKGVLIDKIETCAVPITGNYNSLDELRKALIPWGEIADKASLGPVSTVIRQNGLLAPEALVTDEGDAELAARLEDLVDNSAYDVNRPQQGHHSTAVSDKEVVFWRVLLHDTLPVRMAELRKRGLASETRLRIESSSLHTGERLAPLAPRSRLNRMTPAYWQALPVPCPTTVSKSMKKEAPDSQGALYQGSLVDLDWKTLALCMARTIANWEAFQNIFEDEICVHVNTITRNQVLFVTLDGFLGMGPDTMTEGDEVWVLEGGSHPFVLRPTISDAMIYQLVGECYVSGLMYGEIFSEPSLSYHSRHNPILPDPTVQAASWAWLRRLSARRQVKTYPPAVWEQILLQ